jgi:hypothetical protein
VTTTALPRTVTALCAAVTAAAIVTLSAAVLILHRDVGQLQAQLDARNPGGTQAISCSDLVHVRLLVHGRTARCVTR